MNLNDFMRELCKKLSSFKFHAELIKELLPIMRESGNESSFINQLVYCLSILDDLGVLATNHKNFEPLGNGVYSMRMKNGNYNIRILYMFFPDKSPVLLHAFYERAGHQRTDYTGKIKIARKRFTELKEER
ncbi:type II toxin-antitoxin system RelE/ParE family toxin [uncultured Oscillibacter sp.]|uniref:type II toxin-antitoxin system RelE/ParE family toxin n=1 Tax=uncultured Oscillibacter sp. TaxID=876091 RepID=UPI002804C80F|nr:type II toxin-antitoxin system RelE/ParE family toxin [uncultured Oscillibacter sp.]